MKLVLQFGLPLLSKLWWTQDSQTGYLATVDQFACNETGFNRLANAYVIGDQEAHRVEFERHEQRHQLVGAWFNGDVAKRAKWSSARTESETHSITQQPTGAIIAQLSGVGQFETRGINTFKRQIDTRHLIF